MIGSTEVISDSAEILQRTVYELMDVERAEVTTGIDEAIEEVASKLEVENQAGAFGRIAVLG